ncbi:S_TKc domain-containing protein [Naegleria gruberi]|uniref:S_TKc domain-containing protein n=1 Tax=Naegleria gruberi TaxID=5762 RepID=D2VTH4_NAEGR|nr:S_TKc domain-containing protein [Naegleria gruberi]EFC39859.1 S_TKc domain-containing protein [Naegleria gruberi]|eukprot:XP_002672603.1 S_TKc domain-containing protein [Naegleria gruberi strain NEG-M]
MSQQQFIEIYISNYKTITPDDRHTKPYTNYILDISLQSDKNPQEIFYQWSIEYRYSQLRSFHSLLSKYFKKLPTFPPKKLFNRSSEMIEKRLVELKKYFKQLFKNRNDIFNKSGTLSFILKFINIPNELMQYVIVTKDDLNSVDSLTFLNSKLDKSIESPFCKVIFHKGVRYKLSKFIGNGTYGKVYHSVDDSGYEYAIKEIPALYVDTMFVENNVKLISECNETFLRYILRILDTFQIANNYYVVTEYFNKGSLNNIRNDVKMSVSTILQIIIQMVTSLRFLNSKKMVHLDIKEGNIFVQFFNGHRISLILGDLGLSRKINPSIQLNTINNNINNIEIVKESLFESLSSSASVGTPLYQAPEMLQQENPFIHEKSDIYSLGCTILYYLFGKIKVLNQEKELDWEKINSLFQKLEEPEWKYIYELLQKMLTIDVNERADTKTILDFIFKKQDALPSEMNEEKRNQFILDEMESIDLLTSYVKLQDYFKTSDSIIRDSLYENGNQLEDLPEHFKNNSNYFNIAAQQNSMLHKDSDQFNYYLELAADSKPNNNEITLLTKNSSEQNRNDYYFALSSVSKDGKTLRFVGHLLKMNRTIVMTAVKQNPLAIQYAPSSLRKDKEIAKEALVYNGRTLEYLEELQDDEEIVLAAVSVHGIAIKFASPRLRSHENIIRRAVKVDERAIEYADTSNLSLKLLFEIICQNIDACYYLKYDEKLVMDYVKQTNDSNAKTFLLLMEKKVSMSKMIQLADDIGNPLAQLYVALHRRDNPERMLNAAKQGNLQAQLILARWLQMYGHVDSAVDWLKKCASHSYLPAIVFLCSLLDPATDGEWFLKGAHLGDGEIQYVYGLSIFYEKNRTQINYQGFYWCKRAAHQGFPRAQYHMSQCYKYGLAVNRNPEKAFKWMKLAAENQVIVAQYQLGLFYGGGKGTVQDVKKAFYWLETSAKKKNWVALNELGLIYMKGRYDVKVNYDKAIEYFKKSLQTLEDYKNSPISDDFDPFVNPPKGNGEYLYLNIGECYFLKQKREEGIEWMMKSISLGCEYAVEVLEEYTGIVVSTDAVGWQNYCFNNTEEVILNMHRAVDSKSQE